MSLESYTRSSHSRSGGGVNALHDAHRTLLPVIPRSCRLEIGQSGVCALATEPAQLIYTAILHCSEKRMERDGVADLLQIILTVLATVWQAARNPVDQMTPELWIAQELRRIGDEFNASFTPRRHHLTSGTQVCNIISSYGKSEPYWAQVAFSTILHDPWKMTK
ncbi:BCL2 like 11 L homeolog isoform X4 [Xenopus laevis]|uniref:BCL2 like 11 L homeolog isoform X4 n=1 Tax=Xenopus laevis TaxID=8355 RepID=A0A8J1KLR1_XENLA|nr:BCL2 like 11 L homeolog isoform X4 [Xenopus laevis]